jgi:hypothetical protein
MLQNSDDLIDALVDNLFRSSQLNKDEFHRKVRNTTKKTFDNYVLPFILTEEDKTTRSGLRGIITSSSDPGSMLPSLYLEQYLPALHLEVPKKVLQYVQSSVPIVDPTKAKQVQKTRVARGPQKQFKTTKRALPEVASIYANAQDNDNSEDDLPASKKSRMSVAKSQLEEADSRRVIPVQHEYVDNEPPLRRTIPKNFYTIVAPLFDEFWKMEFDNDEVTWAFFAVITSMNCADYKLSAFAEQSYSLAIIKVRSYVLTTSTVLEVRWLPHARTVFSTSVHRMF